MPNNHRGRSDLLAAINLVVQLVERCAARFRVRHFEVLMGDAVSERPDRVNVLGPPFLRVLGRFRQGGSSAPLGLWASKKGRPDAPLLVRRALGVHLRRTRFSGLPVMPSLPARSVGGFERAYRPETNRYAAVCRRERRGISLPRATPRPGTTARGKGRRWRSGPSRRPFPIG
jgi:hypothetical protein